MFNKTNCYFNNAFCRNNGIKSVGDSLRYDLIASKVNDQKFGIRVNPNGEYCAVFSKNHQMACNIKSYLKRRGYNMSVKTDAILTPKTKSGVVTWWFVLSKELLKVKLNLNNDIL